ncbi:hypothetical protein HGRIS_009367 [Hohenbuehelia grisea]|uniref:Spermine/spermidine synthase n=1 Tax=Hohenbuehelia grisea TaxID=104357 RepID=A0ABR3J115_9AGAR
MSEVNTIIAGLSAVPLAFVFFAYERTLVPLYGSAATNHLLRRIFVAAITLGALNPVRIRRNHLQLALGLLLLAAPNATHWAAVFTSRKHEPVYGPAITHAATLAPLAFLFTSIAAQTGGVPDYSGFDRPLAAILCYLTSTSFLQSLISKLPKINAVSNSDIFLAVAGIVLTTVTHSVFSRAAAQPQAAKSAADTKTKASKKKTGTAKTKESGSPVPIKWLASAGLTAALVMLRPFLSSPVLEHPLAEPYTHPSYPIRIHSSVQSVTGLIVVGEILPPPEKGDADQQEDPMHSARYLRAEHSILGGIWLGQRIGYLESGGPEPWQDYFGTPLGDSIYSTFVLQEAVRLVNSTDKGKQGAVDNGLIIGLGIGTSATAFSRHGVSTTIVEIDPAVYDAARTYFGLPDPGEGKVFLQDARSWASKRRQEISANTTGVDLFDFVVHDCFSGGGVPQHIFTLEFWRDLKATMHEEGVVVVNFAGQINSDSSRAITFTLERAFGQCRAFHDAFEPIPEEKLTTEFVNIVFFCTSSTKPLTFRTSRLSDYLGSPLRRHILSDLSSREIDLALVKGEAAGNERLANSFILTDYNNPLGKWQDEQALHHWTVMRDVLQDIHWETY